MSPTSQSSRGERRGPRQEDERDAPPRGTFRLLLDPALAALFVGKTFANTGQWVFNISAALAAYELGGGEATTVGLVGVALFIPQVVLAPLSGRSSDRAGPVRQIVAGRLTVTLGSGLLATWIAVAGGLSNLPGPTAVIMCSLVVGIGLAVGGPAMQAIVPVLVRESELGNAVVLNTMPMTIARSLGPILGALFAEQGQYAAAFAAAAASNLAFALMLMAFVRVPARNVEELGAESSKGVLKHLRSDKALIVLLIGISACSFGAEPSITLAPTIADLQGSGEHLAGSIASSFGVGCGVGVLSANLVRRRVRDVRIATFGLTLLGAAVAFLAIVDGAALILVAFALMGIGTMSAFSCLTVVVQERSPAHLRGQVMALWLIAFLGARPPAAIASGALTDLFGVDVSLTLTAAIVLGSVALLASQRTLRSHGHRNSRAVELREEPL